MTRTPPPEDWGPGTPRDVEVRVPAQPEALVTVRTVAGDLAARAEFPLDRVDDLRLAVDEASTCLSAMARPGTTLTVTFTVDDARITTTASVSTAEPTTLLTDTFVWRVLTVLADDVRVLAEAPPVGGGAHRLALRMTVERRAGWHARPDTARSDTARSDAARSDAAVAALPDRPGTPGR